MNKEGTIDAKEGKRGRKKLPKDQKRQGKHAYLHQELIDWLTQIGNGNFSTGIETIAKRAGYKEQDEQSKPMVTHRQPHLESELSMCVLEVA